MIPVKLTLRNFMSYGDEPTSLPFEGLHIACLSGDNGNGKSALLDAMTWALWGKTRASSVRAITEDDLIRLGADDMEVRFEFLLNGLHYRVVKKRRRGKTSDWQFAQKGGDGEWAAIGAGSQREIGRLIASVLCMEYDTFLNSAYLQQGRADEFTRQTPDNRKRILGEVLGLDRYDKLEAKAKERFRERKEQAEETEREMRLLENAAARRGEFEASLERTRLLLVEAEAAAVQQEEVWNGLRERRGGLDALAGRLADAGAACQRIQSDIAVRQGELAQKCRRLEEMEATLQQKDAILRDHEALANAERRAGQLGPDIQAFENARSELHITQGAIDQEETRLRGELGKREVELRAVEQQVAEQARLKRDADRLASEAEGGEKVEAELKSCQQAFEEALTRFNELNARNNALKVELGEVDEVLALLESARAACPVCETDLRGEKQVRVVARQQEKRAALASEQKTVQTEGRACKQRQNEADAQVKELQRRVEAVRLARSRHADLVARLAAFAGLDAERKKAGAAAGLLTAQLETGDFAAPKRLHRKRLQAELERLQYARVEFETVQKRIQELKPTYERHSKLLSAEAGHAQELADRAQIEAALAALASERDTAAKRLAELQGRLADYEKVKREEAVADAETKRLQNEAGRLRSDETAFLRYVADCGQAEEQRKAKEAQFKKVDEERKLYHALAQAFGKKGIQTLIIENALPELEEEANSLLARISENAMQVRFDTTRTAKSGGNEIETLDIHVSDDAGTRPYELFSGGEGFRINFAIRIALSRLLARRSGANLQTLILDEGFGSQDGKGREKLIEVLESIKDDFELVLVITHFEEMKDAFSQRIEVIKDANGSRIHLL